METISMKLEKGMLQSIDSMRKKHNYGTRTEFLRAALREKMERISAEEAMRKLRALRSKTSTKANDAEDHRIREEAFKMLLKERGWD